ncbi:hypothetical protein MBLNU230_g6844t1 [Neophaeotheca triangularis]
MRLSLFQRPLFRRSRSQATTTTSSSEHRDHRGNSGSNSPQHDTTPSPSPEPKPVVARPRKSSSFARLRELYSAQAQVPESVGERGEGGVGLPELEGDGGDVACLEEGSSPRRSGKSKRMGDKSEAVVAQVQELRLEQLDTKEQPTLTVQQPTPDFADGVDALAAGGAEVITTTTDDRDAGEADQHTDLVSPEASKRSHSRKSSLESAPLQQQQRLPQDQEEQTNRSSRLNSTTSTGRSLSPFDTSRSSKRPTDTNVRQQSLVNHVNAKVARTLIDVPSHNKPQSIDLPSALPTDTRGLDFFTSGLPTDMAHALHRKIWVRRPGASATLVQIREDDLVDDVRDMILRKYANSLGKTFDAPDMTLHIVTRSEHGAQRHERQLGPEEEMCRTIDSYYPGGQTVDDALLINVPTKRTPRPSPRVFQHPSYQVADDYRPLENGTDYFPPMPAIVPPTMPQTSGSHDSRNSHHPPAVHAVPEHARSMSVLSTGQVPPLPSPGGTRRHARDHRPKFNRQQTSSPTIVAHPNGGAVAVQPNTLVPQAHLPHRPSGVRNRMDSTTSDHHSEAVGAPPPPLPTPPAPQAEPTAMPSSTPQTPPVGPANINRPPRPRKNRKPDQNDSRSRSRRPNAAGTDSPNPHPSYSGLLDGSVPPINVLIVEDNIINLRILEGLMKRLKVRWTTAMNGQIALDKWRAGGFHLVLMDIQMPIMNGLQATKEIRRLERVNGIGVFSSSAPSSPAEHRSDGKDVRTTTNNTTTMNGEDDETPNEETKPRSKEDDKLQTGPDTLFKSPIIIVALTASSLQSDRHEALAAGCNDFLTKPVNFVWLERKVKEWGCMQALIDFDGWRKWKDYGEEKDSGKSEEEKRKEAEKEARKREKMEKFAQHQEKVKKKNEEEKSERERLLEVNRKKESGRFVTTAGAGAASGQQQQQQQQQQGGQPPAKAKRNSSSGVVRQMNGVKEEAEGEEAEAENAKDGGQHAVEDGTKVDGERSADEAKEDEAAD